MLYIAGELMVADISEYKFISHGMQVLPGATDREVFQDTLRAMEIMGITHTDVKCKFLYFLFTADRTSPWQSNNIFTQPCWMLNLNQHPARLRERTLIN